MKYDVVVVGAGPAGSTTAKFLAEKGIKTLVIDKSKFPRNKPCGGGLSIKVLDRYKYLKNKCSIESYSYGSFGYSPSLKYIANVQKKDPIIAMVLRKKFDNELVQLAVDSGADFKDGKTVKNIKISKDKIDVILDDKKEISTEIVVGADGIHSTVAKKAGLPTIGKNYGISFYNEYEVGEDVINSLFSEKKWLFTYLGFQNMHGYGWVFPKKQHINVGIGQFIPDPYIPKTDRKLIDVYKDYIKTLKKNKLLPENLRTGKSNGGVLPVSTIKKTYTNRVLLVGDACGFVNPYSGEGIYYGMISGEIAAGVISDSIEAGDCSEHFLSKYQMKWKEDFGKELKIFSNSVKFVRNFAEKSVKLACIDEKLADMSFAILYGKLDICDNYWKLLSRYFYVYFKDLFFYKSKD